MDDQAWRRAAVRSRYWTDLGPQYETFAERILWLEERERLRVEALVDLWSIFRALGVSNTADALRKIEKLKGASDGI